MTAEDNPTPPVFSAGLSVWVERDSDGDGFSKGVVVNGPPTVGDEASSSSSSSAARGTRYVELDDGTTVTVTLDKLRSRPADGATKFVSAPDCTSLLHLDDANILENLRLRYFSGKCFFESNDGFQSYSFPLRLH